MSFGDAVDLVIGASVLVVAIVALTVRRRDTAVVLFLVFGVLLATLWARLAAPDIALAEAALGAGVTGALLMDTITSSRPREAASSRPWPKRILGWAGGAVAGGAVLVALVAAVRSLSEPQGSLAQSVDEDMGRTGVEHGITAVLLNFRSYDTLLEVAVLAVAALATVSFIQRQSPAPPEPWPGGPPLAVRGLARILTPILLVVAVWLLVAGTTRPGGAFQSGAVIAAVLILLHLGGWTHAVPQGRWRGWGLMVGLIAFIGVGGAGAVVGAGWLVLDPDWAGTIILALEAVLAVAIGIGLATIFVANRTDVRPGGDDT